MASVIAVGCFERRDSDQRDSLVADYVGSTACIECHQDQGRLWGDSLHAWAMKDSTPHASGDFSGRQVEWGGGAFAKPIREQDELTILVKEPGASAGRYPLKYFFGRLQIEQHLVETDGGRLQALPIGFDTVAGDWFDIFGGEHREPADWGHWSNLGMTANSQCLYCHTTGYDKGYQIETNSYDSSWTEIGVGCEACHGPGKAHAEARRSDPEAGAGTYGVFSDAVTLDACAPCHSLRREIAEGFKPGKQFLDFFEPDLIDSGEYWPDGQLRGEAYEWASFLQSRMYREGVTCLDCHDVHSGDLKDDGDKLCLSCHEPEFAKSSHTHHDPTGEGARCVSCHMPEMVFMERDRRRDHAFPRPDPQATRELGIPNACGGCHGDHGPEWAAKRVEEWYGVGDERTKRRELAKAFVQVRSGNTAGLEAVIECVEKCPDAIKRASATRVLSVFVERSQVRQALLRALDSDEGLVRAAAAWALSEDPISRPDMRAGLMEAAGDDLRAVRVNAAWGLRTLSTDSLTSEAKQHLSNLFDEWRESMLTLAEHGATHHTLGLFSADRGETEMAVEAYRRAIHLEPTSLPPRHNLATLLAGLGRVGEAETEFAALIKVAPEFAPGHYAMGLLLGEAGRWPEAIEALSKCLRLDPNYPGALHDLAHGYVAIDAGNIANVVLEAALNYPGSRHEALATLVSANLELGDSEKARRWAEQAVAEYPRMIADPTVASVLGR